MEDLVSLVALLVSQSCNIGLTPVIDPNSKALTRSRLSHVDQNYVRAGPGQGLRPFRDPGAVEDDADDED
jgi:hypothetical protein